MSLLTSTNSGSASQSYSIRNVSQDGTIPCIGTNGVGTVRLQSNAGVANVQSDLAAAGTLRLGSDATSFQNIVLTTGTTTVNGTLSIPGGGDLFVGDDINLGGDLIFTNGATGASITGYYTANVAIAAAGAFANPAGLTSGVYLVVYVPTAPTPGQQPSGVFYWSGAAWNGNAVGANFTGPVPDIAILPVAGGATLAIGGAAAVVPGTVYIRKLMN